MQIILRRILFRIQRKDTSNEEKKLETNRSKLIESECEVRCYNYFDLQIGFCEQFPPKKRAATKKSQK